MKVRVIQPVTFAPPAVLKLTAAQAARRVNALRKVTGGHELLAPVHFKAGEIIKKAGQRYDYISLPDAAHAMHAAQPERFATIVRDWAKKLPA